MSKIGAIGIIGMGLIGGSLAKALKRSEKGYCLAGWDQSAEMLKGAVQEGVLDVDLVEQPQFLKQCDLVIFCVPVAAMKQVIASIKPWLNENSMITDVCSTKLDVASVMSEVGLENRFVGGHPLAGSEHSGYQASKANLFENAFYVMTPDEFTPRLYVEQLQGVITDLGAIPIEMTAKEHDHVTAVISHVPHVTAALLVNLVARLDSPKGYMKTIAAGGFKDITRIASSSPELWAGICLSNKAIVKETIREMEKLLKDFQKYLDQADSESIKAYFKNARDMRNSFSDMQKSLLQKEYDIQIDVDDKPGIIAQVASALAAENINIKNIGIRQNREHDEGALEIRFENEESRIRGIEVLSSLGYQARSKGV